MALREWKKSICISWDSNESERPSRPERAHIEDCWPGWGHVEDRGGRRWGGEQRENGWEDVNYFTISKSIGVNSSFLGPTSQLEMPRTHSEWVFYHARHCFTCRPNIPLYFQNGRMSSKVVFTMKSSETDSGPKEVYHLRSRVPWLLPLWRRPSSPDPQYLCPAEVMPSIVTGSSVPMPSWGDVAHPHRILSAYAQLRWRRPSSPDPQCLCPAEETVHHPPSEKAVRTAYDWDSILWRWGTFRCLAPPNNQQGEREWRHDASSRET